MWTVEYGQTVVAFCVISANNARNLVLYFQCFYAYGIVCYLTMVSVAEIISHR